MTNFELFQILNKYHFITFIVVVFIVFGILEAIEIKWEGRNDKINE